jgi:sporulation protein YlmC with PRC-barrel domain
MRGQPVADRQGVCQPGRSARRRDSEATGPPRIGRKTAVAQKQFTLGGKAHCSDGPCGEVRRMIINPVGGTVTHLVVTPKQRHRPGRLVPVDLVDAGADEITLRCTIAEFGQLDPAEETEMVEGAGGSSGSAPPSMMTSTGGMSQTYRMPKPARSIVQEVVPAGETQVRHGGRVRAADGEIGRVQGFLVDPDDHQVTHVLLQEGHLWGHKEVAIPMSAVAEIDDGIQLRITKQEVENLPALR